MRTGIALGSNLGDRLARLRAGRDFLESLHEGPHRAAVSRVYETEPVGCEHGVPAFLNAVVEIETHLDPATLLGKLRALEREQGRADARAPNQPRPLDLDILYADNLKIAAGPVIIPHPRAAARRFVLQPLADIRPDLALPGGTQTVTESLAGLPPAPAVRLFAREW